MSSVFNLSGRLYGHLKTNIERGVPAGKTAFCAFTVGVYNWREKENDFFDCITFGHNAETVVKFFHPKRAVSVSGRITVNKYKNKVGEDVKKVQFNCSSVDFPTDGADVPTMQEIHAQKANTQAREAHKESHPDPDMGTDDPDELPF